MTRRMSEKETAIVQGRVGEGESARDKVHRQGREKERKKERRGSQD